MRDSVRVLHVIPAVAPRYGGPSEAIVAMTAALEEVGVETLVATTDADGDGRLDVAIGAPTTWRGRPAIFFPRRWDEGLKPSPALARWLRESVGAWDAVHVHAVFSHSSVAAGSACRAADVPYVVRPLGALAPWSMRQKALRKRVFWRAAGARLMAGAAAVHFTSEAGLEEAVDAGSRRKGVVIPLGVDAAALAAPADPAAFRGLPGAPAEDPYVLFLSRIAPKKRLEPLIDAFAEATAAPGREAWRLVIAGDGDAGLVASARRRAEAALGERAAFVGWLEGEAKRAALAGAALFALPSAHENFGIAAVEAMAVGTPVVVSPAVHVAPEIAAAEAGWIVDPPDTLAATLAAAIDDADERARRGAAAAALVRDRFAWSAVADRLAALYGDLATGRLA